MIRFDVDIIIEQPLIDVFMFVADGENGSKWNSAVLEVRKTTPGSIGVGTRYWMLRQLGDKRVENTYEVIEYEANKTLSIKITSGPTPFVYRYTFEATERGTKLSLATEAKKDGLFDVLGAKGRFVPEFVLSRFIKRGVESNFLTLKNLLEHNQ